MLIDDSVADGETCALLSDLFSNPKRLYAVLTPADFGALPAPTPSRRQLNAAIEHVRGRPGPSPDDPTMGDKFEGDIVDIDNVQQFVAAANGELFARNAIR